MNDGTSDGPLSRERIAERVHSLGPWFHNMDLGGVITAPDHFLGDYPAVKWRSFAHVVPDDLRGATVLDVGCNAGFYAIEMKRRGASRVVGIDSSERYLAQARFAAEVAGVPLELRCMTLWELPKLRERFDLVLFMGVLYHLRHPLLALDLLHEYVVSELLLFQTMQRGDPGHALDEDHPFNETAIFDDPGAPKAYFIEHRYAGDPTNWWIPNQACSEAMLRSAGFEITAHPEPEVYLCRRRELDAAERLFRDLPELAR